jgi:hypothetical protein
MPFHDEDGGGDGPRDHEIERRIYERLGHHERLVRVIELLPEAGIEPQGRRQKAFERRYLALDETGDRRRSVFQQQECPAGRH